MRARMNLLLLLVPMAALAVMFQQCSGVNFQNAVLSQQWLKDCQEDASKCRAVSEDFNAGSSNKNIDFTWVVDTSGSMQNEIDHVRSNFVAFAERLKVYSNLQMAIIANKGSSGLALDFPSGLTGINLKHLNTKVESSDALILAGNALCPDNADANSWCSTFAATKKDAGGKDIGSGNWARYENARGELTDFLRPQSHKVFVFVSDDDASRSIPHQSSKHDFLDAYNSLFPHSQPVVYSFVGFQSITGCSIYFRGDTYMGLSAERGGESFDICESDWAAHFEKMLEGMETLVNTSFPLATQNVVEVTAVYLGATKLSPGDWTYANRVVTIRPEVMQGQMQYNIRVELIEYVPNN